VVGREKRRYVIEARTGPGKETPPFLWGGTMFLKANPSKKKNRLEMRPPFHPAGVFGGGAHSLRPTGELAVSKRPVCQRRAEEKKEFQKKVKFILSRLFRRGSTKR